MGDATIEVHVHCPDCGHRYWDACFVLLVVESVDGRTEMVTHGQSSRDPETVVREAFEGYISGQEDGD